MKAIIFALVTGSGLAAASPQVATGEAPALGVRALEHDEVRALHALEQANAQVVATRTQWDRAVAGGHPVAAGTWAVRHFDALQARKAAARRVDALARTVRTPRYSSR